MEASQWRIPLSSDRPKKYALDNFSFFFFFFLAFFPARILGHPSSYVSTDACYRDRNDERGRGRGHASDVRPRRFWKIKFIALVGLAATPHNGLSARKCEKYYVVARRFRRNFYGAAPAQRVGEYDDGEYAFPGKNLRPFATMRHPNSFTKGNYEIPLFQRISPFHLSAC